ncbi:SDR family oxidoreductase [Aeromicrobium sp. CTD01-1L150]|uniref:SDR family oxidoreductase n=1 Tax=Aeromicrobium sp. CTD01-1L150 TaxID=3341830 RepID=UPI0035C0D8BD
MELQHKVAFIAGGTSGINLEIAKAYAVRGARVAVLSRQQQKVTQAVEQLSASTPCLGFAADVRDAASVAQALTEVVDTWGGIDIVISGAAGNFSAAASDLSSNGFKSVVDIDLLGTFNVLRAAWPHLNKPGATVVNISAAQSWLPTQGQAHVGAAKAGVDQLTRTLALEWGPEGVRVNAVAPGPVHGTEGMSRLAPTAASEEAWTQAIPLRRWATAQDVTDAVLWLTSDQASFVTGVVVAVDGGLALGGSSAISNAMLASRH